MKNSIYILVMSLIALNLAGCNYFQQQEQKAPPQETATVSETSETETAEETETVSTPESEITPITEAPLYDYNDETGELLYLIDNKVLYLVDDPMETRLVVLGLEGDNKLIVWETSYENSPGPGWKYEVWYEDYAKRGLYYINLEKPEIGLIAYTVPKWKQEEARKQNEMFKLELGELPHTINGRIKYSNNFERDGGIVLVDSLGNEYSLKIQENTIFNNMPKDRYTERMEEILEETGETEPWFGLMADIRDYLKDGEQVTIRGKVDSENLEIVLDEIEIM